MVRKVLITGVKGYISQNVEKWLGRTPEFFVTRKISLRESEWKDDDWSGYDAIIHTSGIAHIKASNRNGEDYYRINRDLAIEVAAKAKSDGVRQFIFFSSINVYGTRNFANPIKRETIPLPNTHYGMSKLLAEQGISMLANNDFKIAILRLPMIYGDNAKGNYPRLVKYAKKFPIFPDYKNARSMLYIDNLCEFIRVLIVNEDSGLFFPQDNDYVCTTKLVEEIATLNNRKIRMTRLFNPLIEVMRLHSPFVCKVFGNLAYDLEISEYQNNYRICNFSDSVRNSITKM